MPSSACRALAAGFVRLTIVETFDLEQTQRLAALIPVPQQQHDDAWCANFLRAVPNASLASFNPQIQTGPDTFPYFQLALPDPGPFTPFSIVHILNDVLQIGVGVAIHTNIRRDQPPAWVFGFGDILSYSMFADFRGDPKVIAKPDPPRIRMRVKFSGRLPMSPIFRQPLVLRSADLCAGHFVIPTLESAS